MGRVVSVNTGRVAPITGAGRAKTSAIVKTPVTGAIPVHTETIGDDEQADLEHHGGPDQAVYAYARESYEAWEQELGRPLEPGLFGENLTTSGIDVDDAKIGERWRVGTAVLEVTAPRIPCQKFAARMGEPKWVKRFGEQRRPGAYLRVIELGEIAADDEIEVASRPGHDVTIRLVNEVWLHDKSRAPELLPALDALPANIGGWLRERLA